MDEDTRYDGILMTIIQQQGAIDGFFEKVFGFLRRKTDFFANQKNAEEILIKVVRKEYDVYAKEKEKNEKEAKLKAEREEQRRKEVEAKKAAQSPPKPAEAPKPVETPITEVKPEEGKEENGDGKTIVRDEKKAPPGNGGSTDKYIWTQTLDELHVNIPIPENCTKKFLDIRIEPQRIFVGIKNQPPILDAEWPERIKATDSFWTIEEIDGQRVVHLSITKVQSEMHWWSQVAKGEPTIDTQQINPESSNVSDIEDPELKSTVEKMMYDMRQKQMGLPTSEEQEKRSKLEGFMKAHPEMDFSKVKFNQGSFV